jgi:hypothetical protein
MSAVSHRSNVATESLLHWSSQLAILLSAFAGAIRSKFSLIRTSFAVGFPLLSPCL